MSLFLVFIIGISLSMDAFSLALAYGTQNISSKKINALSIIVGIYHYLMPLIGFFIGRKIITLLPIEPNVLVFIILFFIGIEMIVESFKEDVLVNKVNLWEMLVFGFAVSIDSFSLGLSINTIYNPFIAATIFSLISAFFTYIGLKLGKYINQKIGYLSTLFGGGGLIIISFIYLV